MSPKSSIATVLRLLSGLTIKRSPQKKYFSELLKAEVYLRIFDTQIKQIEIINWEEYAADFGNKK